MFHTAAAAPALVQPAAAILLVSVSSLASVPSLINDKAAAKPEFHSAAAASAPVLPAAAKFVVAVTATASVLSVFNDKSAVVIPALSLLVADGVP